MIELERTFLARELPKDLQSCLAQEITDIYIPQTATHPTLRLRKTGNKHQITKKNPLVEGDASEQIEETIEISEAEWSALSSVSEKRISKKRYSYNHDGVDYEIDSFQESLTGLVLVDVEFGSNEEKLKFRAPFFCLEEVTQENFIAGGMLAGKNYEELEEGLEKFNYQKIVLTG